MSTFKIPVLDYYEWQKAVNSNGFKDPPAAPSKGDRYIIGQYPTGAWYNKPKRIAECTSVDPINWDITEPKEGMLTLVLDEGILYQYVNNKWRDFALVIGRRRVQTITDSTSLVTISLDDCGKVFTADSTSMVQFDLPSVTSSDIGVHFTFGRLNQLGSIMIHANDDDFIADSSAGGNIWNDAEDENNTTITLTLLKYNQWVITAGHGTWTVE